MNRTQRTLGALAALPLLLAPLGCEKANDIASAAQNGIEDAAGTAGDALGDAGDMAGDALGNAKDMAGDALEKMGDMGDLNIGDMGKDMLAKGLGGFQPKITEAIDSLKGGSGNLTEGMKEKLSKLTDIQGQLPDLISSLTSGSGDALSGAMDKAKGLMAEIPKLIAGITGN